MPAAGLSGSYPACGTAAAIAIQLFNRLQHRWIAYRKICRSEQYAKSALAIEPDELLFHLWFSQSFLRNAGLQFHDFGDDGLHSGIVLDKPHGLVDHQSFQPLFPHGLFTAGLFLLGSGTLLKSRPHSQIVQFWLADCRSTMWAYSPFRAYSSAGLPCSATMPPDSTTT